MGRTRNNDDRRVKECQNCKRHYNTPSNRKHVCKVWRWGGTCEDFEYDSGVKSYNPKKRK